MSPGKEERKEVVCPPLPAPGNRPNAGLTVATHSREAPHQHRREAADQYSGRPETPQAREASGRANTSRPAVVCRVLVTLTGTVRPIWSRLPSTTTIVPSSR